MNYVNLTNISLEGGKDLNRSNLHDNSFVSDPNMLKTMYGNFVKSSYFSKFENNKNNSADKVKKNKRIVFAN